MQRYSGLRSKPFKIASSLTFFAITKLAENVTAICESLFFSKDIKKMSSEKINIYYLNFLLFIIYYLKVKIKQYFSLFYHSILKKEMRIKIFSSPN